MRKGLLVLGGNKLFCVDLEVRRPFLKVVFVGLLDEGRSVESVVCSPKVVHIAQSLLHLLLIDLS